MCKFVVRAHIDSVPSAANTFYTLPPLYTVKHTSYKSSRGSIERSPNGSSPKWLHFTFYFFSIIYCPNRRELAWVRVPEILCYNNSFPCFERLRELGLFSLVLKMTHPNSRWSRQIT